MGAPLTGDMQGLFHRTWWALLLRGLLALAIGTFILLRPLESVGVLALIIAFWALFSGIVEVVHAFELASTLKYWWILLLSGLLSIAFGIAALFLYPILSLAFAVLWVAWWFLATGVLGIYASFRHKHAGLAWGWTMAFGFLSVAAGGFALVVPPVTIATLIGLIAGFALIAGIVLCVAAFKLRSLVRA
jgi:uncharacterized membrane protein HdeD (DUF308 family)